MEEKIKKTLEEVRPYLQAEGGDVEFISYADGIVKVKLRGACGTCPMATQTLKMGIEKKLKEQIPEIKEVVQA